MSSTTTNSTNNSNSNNTNNSNTKCNNTKCKDNSCSMLTDANNTLSNQITTKNNIIVETSLTTKIPEDEIVLKELEDGFSLEVKHSHTAKSKNSWYESAFTYKKEEHYERKVKQVEGHFNSEGNYEVKVEFEE